jgi:hypothetical protein
MSRLRTPDKALGLAAVILLVSLICPWYTLPDGTVDGWRSLALIDVWLFITALIALTAVILQAVKDSPAMPVAFDVLTIGFGLIASILMLYRLLSVANSDVVTGRSWGLIVAAIGTFGTFAAAWWATRTEAAPGLRPPPEVRAMPVPPEHDPVAPPAA